MEVMIDSGAGSRGGQVYAGCTPCGHVLRPRDGQRGGEKLASGTVLTSDPTGVSSVRM